MVAVNDLWRTEEELIEKFAPLLNRVFKFRKQENCFKHANCSGDNTKEDSFRIFSGAHDYKSRFLDDVKQIISATLTRYSVSKDILKYNPNRKGTTVAQLLRCCATNRKVALIGIFH